MQIDGGKNDKFVAYADSGALVMSHWDGSAMAQWKIAQRYTLEDDFFMGAFGGSFMNHIWLSCACVATYPDADKSPAKPSVAVVEPDGVTLKLADNSPKSAIDGIPKFVADGNLTPDFYAVNTMQPPYQPSANAPAKDGDARFADPGKPTTLPPQTQTTIGDLLSAKDVTWAWYGGAWQSVLDHGNSAPFPAFQYHHQPFNFFASFAPGTAARTEHLRDGGLDGAGFIKAIDEGRLPQVAFYKPQGNLNQHSGYADIASGDSHIADLVEHLEHSPQWGHMVVVITFDENGGIWDHVAPPRADRWGPGTRIPAIIVSPFAKRGFVDHTPNDTTSILRLITRRFDLPVLKGIAQRGRSAGGAWRTAAGRPDERAQLHSEISRGATKAAGLRSFGIPCPGDIAPARGSVAPRFPERADAAARGLLFSGREIDPVRMGISRTGRTDPILESRRNRPGSNRIRGIRGLPPSYPHGYS